MLSYTIISNTTIHHYWKDCHEIKQHQIHAVLGFLALLWCFHQSNALQEGEQHEQLIRQRVVEHFILRMRRVTQDRRRRLMRQRDYDVLSLLRKWRARYGINNIWVRLRSHLIVNWTLHSEANRDLRFLADESSVVWSTPEFEWAFTPPQTNRSIWLNAPGFH